MRSRCVIEESSSSLSSPWNCPSFLQEWKLMRRSDRSKLRSSKLLEAVRTFLSDHHCLRKYLISRESIENSPQNSSETKVLKSWQCPKLSISMNQSKIHHSEIISIRTTRSSIRPWERDDQDQPTWTEISWMAQLLIHLQLKSIKL